MTHFIFPAIFSLLFSLLIGNILCKVSIPKRMYDYPSKRKIHLKPTPKVGGIIIFSSLLVSSFLFELLVDKVYNHYITLCIAFFLCGLLDDAFDWHYRKKLLAQILLIILFLLVIPIDVSTLTFSSISIHVPWLNYLLLLLWILGIINAFNFFDGINYLAGCLAIVFFISYSLLSFNFQSVIQVEVYLILIYSILGFLFFNRAPAKMFLGDSGSMFLGFLIATLPLLFTSKTNVGIDVTFPVIITSILLMETIYLIISRIKNKKSPFAADKTHLHHQLLNLNLRNRYVVLIIVFGTILFSILAYFSRQLVFYQIIVIELFLFSLIIVLPRFLARSRKPISIG